MQKLAHLSVILVFASSLAACAPTAGTSTPNQVVVTALPTSTPTNLPCTVFHIPATPAALGAEFESRAHISGPVKAPVSIVVFSDYQCPACAILDTSLKKIRLTHPNDVRLVFVNTPISSRDKDAAATQAVEAADLQGKFWEMHDVLFEKLAEWTTISPTGFEDWAVQQAATLGIDTIKYKADYEGSVVAGRVKVIDQSATSQSVNPPILFVNSSSRYTGLADFASLDSVVRIEALSSQQFSACPAWVINPLKQYIATLRTSKGNVIIQLFPDKAPMAVDNFIWLARSHWYDDNPFYKVLPDTIAMTGDPSGTGIGNPGYLFETEIPASPSFNQAGMVALDNSGPDTNGSRFFITLAPAAQLNGQYTIIGKVLSGMNVLITLLPRDPKPGISLPPGDILLNIIVQEQ
jgi:cyclophilin family peptidyl-prolyl cis-trans isomerase/protein-disulfide isomerase